MNIRRFLGALVAAVCVALPAIGQQPAVPPPQPGSINGTVIDVNGDIVPRATVVLTDSIPGDRRSSVASDNGFFVLGDLKPGIPYTVTISAPGFAVWTAPPATLDPGQFIYLTNVRLRLAEVQTTVNAVSTEEIATQQVRAEEKQRVLGVIPNFYISYDPHAVPLPAKLKFSLALRTAVDPVTFAGVALVASTDQAGNTPNYPQGAMGYGQRLGANYANGFTDIMLGGAILPSLLHQDPRYFYQGTGTTRSRFLHAISAPIICRGDDGRRQPNFSAVGGDLISGAISNAYYPASNRGPGLVFDTALIDAGARMTNGIIQEFVLRRLTTRAQGLNAQSSN
ncbi:MAG TPA: carboxypeptidase-like regulatory domain-containing protein [Acidobacteriaceae bacterium]|jgi:hypothetical protein|nr:carboxypeptidase-like regulatory domain-containing protein [Acidobacteriaceae bacterium]